VKFFDLFAGIGGFRLALEREGYECVGFCEIDKWARKLYKAYYDTEGEVEYEDATKIVPELLPDFDVLTAGFPCQAFSIAGKRRGFEDTRGTLFFEIARIARVKRPTYLLLENVKGLLSHDGGRTFETILKTLDELGYDAEWQVLNSKDFGVPQNRERVFIVGHLRGKSRPKVFPITEADKVYYEPPKAEKKYAVSEQPTERNGNLVYDPYNGKVREDGTVGTLRTNYSNGNSWIVERPRKVGNIYPSGGQAGNVFEPNGISPCLTRGCGKDNHWGGGVPLIIANTVPSGHRAGNVYLPEGIAPTLMENHGKVVQIADRPIRLGTIGSDSQGNRIYSPKGLAPTLISSGSGNKAGLYLLEDLRIRRLTPLECFRLQGFPDDIYYKAKEIGISDTQLYKMTGNTVTVQVVQTIARKLFNKDGN